MVSDIATNRIPCPVDAVIQIPERSEDVHLDDASHRRLADLCRSLHHLRDSSPSAQQAANVLITGWGSDRKDINDLRFFPNLALIAHLGGSIKSVVSRELLASGVRVTQAATMNAQPVAEFTLATMLLHAKQVRTWETLYRQQRSALDSRQAARGMQIGIRHHTVGLIGASRIGRRVIELLRPHGPRLLLHDPHVSQSEATALGVQLVSLPDLIQQSSIVSLHQPLLPDTEGVIGHDLLSLMPDHCLLINTARGRLIDHTALIDILRTRPILAVLDVTDPEPLPDDSPLWDLPNVQLTPHIAGSMGEEVSEMTALVLDEIERFSRGDTLQHEVTLADWDRLA